MIRQGRVTFQFRVFDGLAYSQVITVALDVVMPTVLLARLGDSQVIAKVLQTFANPS